MNEVMQMLKTDSKYKSGWKFSHVWDMIKDFEKFKDCAGSSRQQASRGMQNSDSESKSGSYFAWLANFVVFISYEL